MRILSLGFNRQLLTNDYSGGDVNERMKTYASLIDYYVVVAHSLRKHSVPSKKKISEGIEKGKNGANLDFRGGDCG